MKTLTVEKMGVAAAVIAAVGGAFFFMQKPAGAPESVSDIPAAQQSEVSAPTGLGAGQSVTEVSPETKKYTHSLLGFSFTYPSSYTISSFGSVYDSTGETVLLQSGDTKGLQVLVTPFDEDVVLTAVRIHHDLPKMEMTNVLPRTLGVAGKSVQAVSFTSSNSLMGKSREVWFVREKRLYQISAPVEAGDIFDSVLSSWQF